VTVEISPSSLNLPSRRFLANPVTTLSHPSSLKMFDFLCHWILPFVIHGVTDALVAPSPHHPRAAAPSHSTNPNHAPQHFPILLCLPSQLPAEKHSANRSEIVGDEVTSL
jgi:hypothetical protein